MNRIENNIKNLREKRNIYQQKLAIDLELSQETISAYERQKIVPSAENLIKLADYFNTNIDYILRRTDYDLQIKDLKPNNLTDDQFKLLNKISKLSKEQQVKAEAYIDCLNDN